MAVVAPSKRRLVKRAKVKELNMMPVMNLFLVLIPALLTMWVSVHLAMVYLNLNAGAGSGGGAGGGGGDNKKEDVLKVGLFGTYFEVQDGETATPVQIPALDTSAQPVVYDYKKLDEMVHQLKVNHPNVKNINVAPTDDVTYDTLIKAIDICKFNGFPNIVYLANRTNVFQVQ